MGQHWDVIVVGGGLAGLGAGVTATAGGARTLVLEAGAVGGRARTHAESGFVFNLGAHAERAAFLLADVFRVPYAEVAAALGKSEVACRQIVSRARKRLSGAPVRRPTGGERRVLEELVAAILSGDVEAQFVLLNGEPGLLLVIDGRVDLAVGANLTGDRVSAIWLVRNPDKLHRQREPSLLQ